MITEEIKRIFLKEKLLILFIISFTLGLVYQIYDTSPIYSHLDKKYYINEDFLKGFPSKTKDKCINDKEEILKNIEVNSSSIIDKYKQNKLSDTEFINEISKLSFNRKISDKTQEEILQYRYISQFKNSEYTNVNGFYILINSRFDFFILTFMIIAFSITFLKEKNGLDLIKKSTYNGMFHLDYKRKYILFTTFLLYIILTELFKIIYIDYFYGFGNWNASIQSIPLINNSIYNLTILQLYFITLIYKIMWIILTMIIMNIISKKIRDTIHFIFYVFIIYFTPIYLLPINTIIYIPFISYSSPIHYFIGTIFDENNSPLFYQVNYKINLIIFLLTLIIIFINKKITKLFLLSAILIISISACNTQNKIQMDDKYNSSVYAHFEISNNHLFDIGTKDLIRLSDNQKFLIERNPFAQDELITSGNCYNNKYYYIVNDKGNIYLKELHLDNFQSKIIYTIKKIVSLYYMI